MHTVKAALEELMASMDRIDAQVIMISGHGNVESAVRATKLGAFDFLEKPLALERTVLAVRNALRHGRPSELIVRVGAHETNVTLEVIDDGVGFEPTSPRGDAHFGLRGLKDLIHDAGGRIDVQSAPGEGTTVRLEVAR